MERYRLGLIIDYINSEYTRTLIDGMREACNDFEVELLIFSVAEINNLSIPYDYQSVAISALVRENNLDGVVMAAGSQMHYLTKAELFSYVKSFQPLPVVSLSVDIPGVPSIVVNSYSAYDEIISELIEKQFCRRFCVLGVRGNSTEVKNRIKNIRTILQRKYIPSKDVAVIKSVFDYGASLMSLQEFYKSNHNTFDYDAVLAMNDEMAFSVIEFLHSIGKKVPEDVAVVGFDDIERSSFSSPTLTSISQDLKYQAYASVLYMKEILDGKPYKMLKTIDAKPVFRNSTSRKTGLKAVNEKETSFAATEWYAKKSQLYHITRYYTDMQTDISIDNLQRRMNDDMKSFGLKALAIIIYDEPVEKSTPFDYFNLPHKAKVFAAFDYSSGFDSKKLKSPLKFDPNECMIPEGVLYYQDGEMYVSALYHNSLQYGYIIFRPGSFDLAIYDLLTRFLGTIISSVYQYTQIHNEGSRFKARNKQLDLIARTDELTGLLNRRGLYDMGQTTLKYAKSMGQSGLVVYCDMDGLKMINDSFGHEAGDQAIVAEAQILKKNFRSNDVVARLGGDEFAMVSPGLTAEAFERIKHQIEEDCEAWCEENKVPYTLSISMGAVPYPTAKNEYSLINLLSEADDKLYEVKNLKKAARKA